MAILGQTIAVQVKKLKNGDEYFSETGITLSKCLIFKLNFL